MDLNPEDKICPMTFNSPDGPKKCQGELCGWWVEDNRMYMSSGCAILSLDYLDAISTMMP